MYLSEWRIFLSPKIHPIIYSNSLLKKTHIKVVGVSQTSPGWVPQKLGKGKLVGKQSHVCHSVRQNSITKSQDIRFKSSKINNFWLGFQAPRYLFFVWGGRSGYRNTFKEFRSASNSLFFRPELLKIIRNDCEHCMLMIMFLQLICFFPAMIRGMHDVMCKCTLTNLPMSRSSRKFSLGERQSLSLDTCDFRTSNCETC